MGLQGYPLQEMTQQLGNMAQLGSYLAGSIWRQCRGLSELSQDLG